MRSDISVRISISISTSLGVGVSIGIGIGISIGHTSIGACRYDAFAFGDDESSDDYGIGYGPDARDETW